MSAPTPHNKAKPGDIAKTVLMPGDPLRAKLLAETYLQDAVCYNQVRGMLGFTGKYQGIPVSVQGSGMGMPSMGIYSHELFHFYGVDTIIRIGSAGAIDPSLKIGDIVIAVSSCTTSSYSAQYHLPGPLLLPQVFLLPAALLQSAKKKDFVIKQEQCSPQTGFTMSLRDFLNGRKWVFWLSKWNLLLYIWKLPALENRRCVC